MAKVLYIMPPNLQVKYYRYIGEIAARWSMVELHLQEIIWDVLKLGPKKGRLLTYWPGAKEKIQVFQALDELWIQNPLLIDKFKKIAKKVDRLNTLRNDYVHGVFGHEPGKPKELNLIFMSKVKNKIMPRAERKTVADIKKVADDIAALQGELKAIQKTLRSSKP